jgi:hypothetical protein
MTRISRVLVSIPATEPASFFEVLDALGDDKPETGDKAAWRELFQTLESFEQLELVEIERRNGRIEALQLTAIGAERAREVLRGSE